jgi:hypothetical protein
MRHFWHKYIQNIFTIHYEIIFLFIEFNVLWLQILKEIWIIKVATIFLKLIGQYGVQKKKNLWILRYKDHCIFKQGIAKNCTFFMLKHTWYIEKNRPSKKLLAFTKTYFQHTFTMHNNEKVFFVLLVSWKHKMY